MYREEIFRPDVSELNLNDVEDHGRYFEGKGFSLEIPSFYVRQQGSCNRVAQADIERFSQKGGNVRIDSGTVEMYASRTYQSSTLINGSMKIGQITLQPGLETGTWNGGSREGTDENAIDASDLATHFRSLSNTGRVSEEKDPEDTLFTIRQRCIQFLMELIFGIGKGKEVTDILPGKTAVYEVHQVTQEYYHKEEECTTFSTVGCVKTADGRELSFQLECGMSRSLETYYKESYLESGISYIDPLVINLDTDVASVSDQKFFFDLDCDGSEEEISLLKAGTAFLALDRNGDGVIGDGSELFGTQSGDGFRDLEEYDEDRNGWIDEGDPIWEKLLIWTKDEAGNDRLYHLRDLGIGAIGLSNVSTDFTLKSQEGNQTNAMIRNTGIFLYENGTVSTIQHLDLAR